MTLTEAETLAPNFHFDLFFAAMDAPKFSTLNVTDPEFFKQVNSDVLDAESLEALRTLCCAGTCWTEGPHRGSPSPLSTPSSKSQKTLTGQSEIKPRWRRCVTATDGALGEALGQRYVEQAFGADGKQRMLKMVDALEKESGSGHSKPALDDRRNQEASQNEAGRNSQ